MMPHSTKIKEKEMTKETKKKGKTRREPKKENQIGKE
jgi:hypothetical protein